MLTEIQTGHFWVDDLGDEVEYAIVTPPGPWADGNAHWITWLTPHSLDHCYKRSFFGRKNGNPLAVGNYAFPPQSIHWCF